MKNKPIGRVLPPEYRFTLDLAFARRFTWKERLKILCGYTATIEMRVGTQYSPGAFLPKMDFRLTENKMPVNPPKP